VPALPHDTILAECPELPGPAFAKFLGKATGGLASRPGSIAVQVKGDRISRRDGEVHDAFMNRVRSVHPLDMIVLFGKGDTELL